MNIIQHVATTSLPTRYGTFAMQVYKDGGGIEHVAMICGTLDPSGPVLVRLHSECLTGDVFGSARCDCGEQLDYSLKLLQQHGNGVLLYLRQEGRGIGLTNKVRAYALQDQGLDTVDANRALGLPDDMRDYQCAAAILSALGIQQVELLTNNPAKILGLEQHGIRVARRMPLQMPANEVNSQYLRTKQARMGHMFEPPGAASD